MDINPPASVGYFVPPPITPNRQIYEEFLSDGTWQYASKGRWALFHILRSLGNSAPRVAIPEFICPSILPVLKTLNAKIVPFGMNKLSMQPSSGQFRQIAESRKIDAALVPSYYGFPANLNAFEHICRKHGIFMIDDAAQSFGALCGERSVGTFGEAGFFSFSPGKSHAGHMGALFRINKPYSFKKKKDALRKAVHRLLYWDYKFNREHYYFRRRPNPNNLFSRFLQKTSNLIDIKNDDCFSFEQPLLGGMLAENKKELIHYRTTAHNRFSSIFREEKLFRIVRSNHGRPNPVKIVLLFHEKAAAARFRTLLSENRISYGRGYRTIHGNSFFNESLIELPIDPYQSRMNYLNETIHSITQTLLRPTYST